LATASRADEIRFIPAIRRVPLALSRLFAFRRAHDAIDRAFDTVLPVKE
jgi:hypothetical protein